MKLKIIVHKYIPLVLNGIIIHQMLILSIRVIIFPLCQHERVLFISVESATGKFSKYPQSFECRVESQEITFFCENKKMYSQEERPTFMTFVFQAVNNSFLPVLQVSNVTATLLSEVINSPMSRSLFRNPKCYVLSTDKFQ